MSLLKKLLVLSIVVAFAVVSTTSVLAETIGGPVTSASNIDGANGQVYIFGGGNFTTAGIASSFAFYSNSTSRNLTPLLLQGSGTATGNTYTIVGVGSSVASNGSGTQTGFTFTPLAGSAAVNSGYTFGYFDGLVSSNGSGGVTLGTKNAGTVRFDSPTGSGASWLFTGSITINTLNVGTVFKVDTSTGGSGSVGDPYKVVTDSPSGRLYHMSMTANAVPEPSTFVLIGIASLFGLRAVRRRAVIAA